MIITPEAKSQPHDKADYRFRRGSKLADFPPVHPEAAAPPLSSFDGPFQLAEYLSLKVRTNPHDIKALVDVPADNAKAADKHVWIYEHLRRIPIDATPLITQLLQICSRESCPEMKADEWQYLCVAHGGEGTDRCCAIDYILHAVDSTTALLNSSNYFPSRLQIPHASLAHFPSLFRRLSRIFSHAYFHHREAFATAEAETSLYARFVALCEKYELVSSNLLIIPQSGYEVTVMREDDDEEEEVSLDSDEEEAGGAEEKAEAEKEEKAEKAEEQAQSDKAAAETGEAAEAPTEAETDRAFTSPPPDGAVSPREDLIRSTHSLGRYQSPSKWATSPVQPATKGKPAPAHTSESLSPPSTRASLEYEHDKAAAQANAQAQPPTSTTTSTLAPSGKTGKRGTLSRGKTPRGANVWSDKGEDESPLPANADETIGMARKESVDSVVYVGKDGEEEEGSGEDKPTPAAAAAEGTSPKPASSPKPKSTASEPLSIPSPSPARKPASPPAPLSPPKGSPRLALSPKSVLAAFPDRASPVASPSPKPASAASAASAAQAVQAPKPAEVKGEEDDTLSTSPTPSPASSPLTSTAGLVAPKSPTKAASAATSTALAAPPSPSTEASDSTAAEQAPKSPTASAAPLAPGSSESEGQADEPEAAAPTPAPAPATPATPATPAATTPANAASTMPASVTPATPSPATPAAARALGTSPRSELQARPGGEQLSVSRGSGRRGGQGRKSRVPRSPGKKGRKDASPAESDQ